MHTFASCYQSTVWPAVHNKNKANKITNIADSSLPDAPAFALLLFSAMPALNAQA